MNTIKLSMLLLPETFAICKVEDPSIILDNLRSTFYSITRTSEEISVICPEESLPEHIIYDSGWRCIKIEGILDLSLIGVLASLTQPLAQAGINVLTLCTYNTDYLFLKAKDLIKAVLVLEESGHQVSGCIQAL